MVNTRFLDFLTNILFLLFGTGVIASVITVITVVFYLIKGTSAPESKIELPEEPKLIPARSPQLSFTKGELHELLFELEKEKRAAAFGFLKLPPTGRETVIARVQKLERRIQEARALLLNDI